MRALGATFVVTLLLLSTSPMSTASPIDDLPENYPSFDPLEELLQTLENATAPRVMVIGIDGVRSESLRFQPRETGGFARMTSEGAWTYDSNVCPISIRSLIKHVDRSMV